jgi:hypothetical protein
MARNNRQEPEYVGPSSIDTLAGTFSTLPKLKRGESLKDFGINTTARRNKKLAAKGTPVEKNG